MSDAPKTSLRTRLRPTQRDGQVFALGSVVGGLVVGALVWLDAHHLHPHVIDPDLGPLLSGIGALLGGAATLAGVVLAAKGFVRWEYKQRKEHQFKVAGEAYLAGLRLCKVLRRIIDHERPEPNPKCEIDIYNHWRELLL